MRDIFSFYYFSFSPPFLHSYLCCFLFSSCFQTQVPSLIGDKHTSIKDKSEILSFMDVARDYVFYIHVTQLLSHFDLRLIFSHLVNLVGINLTYGYAALPGPFPFFPPHPLLSHSAPRCILPPILSSRLLLSLSPLRPPLYPLRSPLSALPSPLSSLRSPLSALPSPLLTSPLPSPLPSPPPPVLPLLPFLLISY